MQNFPYILNILIIALPFALVSFMSFDFVIGLIQLWKRTGLEVAAGSAAHPNSEILLPKEQLIANTQENLPTNPPLSPKLQSKKAFSPAIEPTAQQPMLQRKSFHLANEEISQPTTCEHLLTGINLDKLPLSLVQKIARKLTKIASQLERPELAIAQKVNGKNQRVARLRAQLRKRLEQAPEIIVPLICEMTTQQPQT